MKSLVCSLLGVTICIFEAYKMGVGTRRVVWSSSMSSFDIRASKESMEEAFSSSEFICILSESESLIKDITSWLMRSWIRGKRVFVRRYSRSHNRKTHHFQKEATEYSMKERNLRHLFLTTFSTEFKCFNF